MCLESEPGAARWETQTNPWRPPRNQSIKCKRKMNYQVYFSKQNKADGIHLMRRGGIGAFSVKVK